MTHLSTENNSLFGIKQEEGIRKLVYTFNDVETVGERILNHDIWLQSQWGIDGVNTYSYSLDGKTFISFGNKSQMTWGSYRGDRIGIFNFNTDEDKGYIDCDFFNYTYSKK